MKKMIKLAGALGLGLVGLAMISCDNSTKSNGLQTKEEVMTVSALSGIGILNELQNNQVSLSNNKTLATADTTTSNVTTNDAADVIEYIEMFSSLLITDGITNVKNEASDNPLYENKVIVNTKTLLDGKQTYTLYYNETIELDDDDDYDDEKEYRLEGIAIFSDITYELRGERETERDESEVEYTLRNGNDYVVISQEIEDDEQEFEYNVYKNGRKVLTQEIEIEIERNYTEIEFKEKADSTKVKFKVKALKDGKIYVKYYNQVYELVEDTTSTNRFSLVESNKRPSEVFDD